MKHFVLRNKWSSWQSFLKLQQENCTLRSHSPSPRSQWLFHPHAALLDVEDPSPCDQLHKVSDWELECLVVECLVVGLDIFAYTGNERFEDPQEQRAVLWIKINI
ncbi:Hypothetical predicted protein [Podarcis lilfordi]|uniref:Uncharacterized protein n=1 Tax=Podarcis lilfordi TaxID=74358 RepID=A0AA35KTD2_9SAUR|nr:Hypothetical predicted protein [Podarcis lilfordi]